MAVLTDKSARSAKCPPGKKMIRIADGDGLYLQVDPNGAKHWRLRYGRTRMMSLGSYPLTSLGDARKKARKQRALIEEGIDPVQARRDAKAAQQRVADGTFAACAEKWLTERSPGWSDATRRKMELVTRRDLVGALGKRAASDITSGNVVRVLQRLAKHAPALAPKAAGAAQGIIRLAIRDGFREDGRILDLDLRHNLPAHRDAHYSAPTTPDALAGAIAKIRSVPNPVTRAALLVGLHTAQRPGNVAAMRWADVNLAAAEWLIPAEAMKMEQSHLVPLSRQSIELIESMRPFGSGDYVFPALARQKTPHINRDTLSKALRDVGLRGLLTTHGVRAAFRTIARERLRADADVLEAALAHAKRGQVAAAYDRTQFLVERRELAQRWSDYLDRLESGDTNVVAFRRA